MSEPDPIRLQPLARAKIGSLGEDGQAWLAELPGILAALEDEWRITLGRPLPGGSTSYVLRAVTADASPVVVKVSLDDGLDGQVATLQRADGRGYARLLAYDPARQAMLLEALGDSLAAASIAPEAQLLVLADTLALAWQEPPTGATPVDKAGGLGELIERWWTELDRPCSAAVYRQALDFAARRQADPGEPVVVHGDPHPGNLLRVLTSRPGGETGYCFVDPDGFVVDRAYDLGVVLRDWTDRLEGTDARAVLRDYCTVLARRTGVDPVRIWEWGFVERVSTGLYLKSFGADGLAARFLASAESLV
jgi:streptomycin 6-kinase